MAKEITLKKDGLVEKSYIGFSWTTLFFGSFVALFRGDMLSFLALSFSEFAGYVVQTFDPLLSNENGRIFLLFRIWVYIVTRIIIAFLYNKIYTKNKLKEGFVPADDYSENLLKEKGYIS